MKTRIDWVRENCALLSAVGKEFAATQPFAGKTIIKGCGIRVKVQAKPKA
jgi:hypothetical protein